MAQPETQYVTVGDADVAYQVVGDAPRDLLFCYGLGSHIEFVRQIPGVDAYFDTLASSFRLIMFDRRGTGASDGLQRNAVPTLEEWTEDIHAALVASFDGPAHAIQCAQAIVSAAAGLDLQIRAGLHTGECEVRGNDLGGLAVHIAARVSSLAGPGEVCVSGTVKDLVVGSDIAFVTRGEHSLQGVPGEWKLFAVKE